MPIYIQYFKFQSEFFTFLVTINMKKYILFIFLIFLSENLKAAPSGADLLSACEKSLKQGFQSTAGMMCVWYVTPCDCHHGKEIDIPRVCLPEDKKVELLAREVIEGLSVQPELQSKSAELSAGIILSAKYPCN